MKKVKRLFSAIISLAMVFSMFAAFSVQATDTTGIKKWSSYQNNQNMTVGNNIAYGSSYKDQWRYMASGDVNSGLCLYKADPLNSKNIAVQYNGGMVNGAKQNQIAYFPTTSGSFSDGYSVEMRVLLPTTMAKDYQYQMALYDANNKSSHSESLVIKWTGGNFAFTLNGVGATSNPKVALGEWLDIKLLVKNNKVTVYENGKEYVTADVRTNSDLFYVFFKDVSYGTGNSVYLDDVRITNESTTDIMYYDDFATSYNYEYVQGTGNTTINVYEEVKLVDSEGNDTGYSVPIYATATADISKLGTFSTTTDVAGLDEPINISWTVYKEQLAWQETFQGYEDSDMGKAPHLDPYANSSDNNGKTVEFEPDFDTEDENDYKENKLLKYTTSKKDKNAIFTNGEWIDGRVKVGYRFMVPEIYDNGQFATPIMGYSTANAPLIDLNIAFNNKGGYVFFKRYTSPGVKDTVKGSEYIVSPGCLEKNTWYTLDFDINLNTDTFTYSLNGSPVDGEFSVATADLEFTQVRLYQTYTGLTDEVTLYFDDLYVNKYLTIKETVNEMVTVYQSDTIDYPKEVSVLLTDDRTTFAADVTWNGSIDTTTLGTKTITGTVAGTPLPVTLTATVSPYPYEIVAPVLISGGSEVFGLIDGGNLTAVTIRKISNNTIEGNIYTALYDGNGKLLNISTVAIPTEDVWVKDDMKDIEIDLSLDVENDVNIDECSLKIFVLADSLTPYAISNTMTNTNGSGTPTIWIAGDSTAARYSEARRPETGWAEMLKANYADAANIIVQNGTINGQGGISNTGAAGGQSSKSYVNQGRLAKTLANAQPGDYLFIQFGHNDSADEEYRHTEPDTTYREYITTFVTEARAHGVIPVIFTSIVRGTYKGANGAFNGDTHANLDEYARVAKEVAAQYHVPVVDLHKKTGDVLREMSLEQSKQYFLYISACTDADNCINKINGESNHSAWCVNYPDGIVDSTHLNHYGAAWVAELAVEGLKEIKLPLANLMSAE